MKPSRKPGKTARASRAGGYGIQSASLALRILEKLAAMKGSARLTDLARELGITKWRLFRHLHTLREEGYVMQDPDTERFGIGIRMQLLAASLPRRMYALDVSRPIIEALQGRIGYTVVLSKFTPQGMVLLHNDAGTGPVKIVMQVGSILGFHESAHGKVAMAFGPDDLLRRVVSGPLVPQTPKTITDPKALAREVGAVRKQGWALSLEEHRMGLNSIAVPVYSSSGFEGALAFVYPVTSARNGAPPKAQRDLLLACAGEISRALGAAP
jgi:IclR family KDG regulon transcriptional repressor